MSHMETYDCKHRETGVEDFAEAHKNRFNGIKDKKFKIIHNNVPQV